MASGAAQKHSRRDWASLTDGPAGLIAERVLSNDYVDFLRFRAVCAAWRACCAGLCARGALDKRFHPRRWVMLPHAASDKDIHGERRFLNVATGELIHVGVPDLRRCHLLGRTAEGFLVLCRRDTLVVQLCNPLTAQIANLPCAASLLDDKGSMPERKLMNLVLRGAGVAGDSTVALHVDSSSLAVAKPGDLLWTNLKLQHKIGSVVPFAGQIYLATSRNISVLETVANQPPRLAVAAGGTGLYSPRRMSLVDNDGELILSCSACSADEHSTRIRRKNYLCRVRLDTRNTVPAGGLNGRALFTGATRSLVVAAGVSPSVTADTVYVCKMDERTTILRQVVAVDLLGGSVEVKFDKEDTAYYLACYVCCS
ncbi:hypothetical protein ACP70R_005516 [Stipagrostis hirtigluma subsp. patula]